LRVNWLLLILMACPAERLGVELPEGGVDAMSNEDLQRDVWTLSRGTLSDRRPGQPGHEAGLAFIGERLQAMHTLPAFGESTLQPAGEGFNLCTVQKGVSQEHILISTRDDGLGAYRSASGVAGLISLAKSFDTRERPAHSVVFCVIAGEAGELAIAANPVVPSGSIRATFNLGPMGARGEEPDPARDEDLDFRVLLEAVRQIRAQMEPFLKP
jgi:hypothetical protein